VRRLRAVGGCQNICMFAYCLFTAALQREAFELQVHCATEYALGTHWWKLVAFVWSKCFLLQGPSL
jgi:hypothetical protein